MGLGTDHIVKLIQRQVDEKRIVLWRDPGGTYTSLASGLTIPDTRIHRMGNSYLALRRQVDDLLNHVQNETPPRLVVYHPDDLVTAAHALDEFAYGGVALATVPPHPMPEPTLAPSSGPDAQIELRVEFAQEKAGRWQETWTVVQWQDPAGQWHDVEGWRGTLDDIAGLTGSKLWWVGRADLGRGPFRWRVYDRFGGKLAATSLAFRLPDVSGQRAVITVQSLR